MSVAQSAIKQQADSDPVLAALLSRMSHFEHCAIFREPYNKKDYCQCVVLVAHLFNRERLYHAPLPEPHAEREVHFPDPF